MTYFISWLVMWAIKAGANGSVYRDQGREEMEYTMENRMDSGWAEGILVTFKFWWTNEEMLEDPKLKRAMIFANVTNVVFFLSTLIFITIWFVGLLQQRQQLMGH
jgi:hypothetical protein